jgi:glycosyltransferase involved in cell wall biosynthesis
METLAGKKVLFLFGDLQMGGAERQGLLLARHLHEQQGALVQVWGLGRGTGPVAEQCDQWGIPWQAVPLHWGLRRRLPHLIRLAFKLRQLQPDLLLSYTKVPNLAAALLWRQCRVRCMVWNQADAGLLLEPGLLHRYAIGRVRHFIANTASGQEFLVQRYGRSRDQIRLIRNGIALVPPQQNRAAWRQQLKVGSSTPLAVMVANLSRYKDHKTLLQAWRLLLDGWDSRDLPVLALAGRFDDQTAALQQQAEQSGVSGQVRFIGSVADISGLLQASDLLVHSSISEGIPNAVLEGMASGLAVVGSDIPGLHEAVGPDGVPFLAPVRDSRALAELLRRLLTDEAVCRQQGALMQKRAEQQFGRERMCQESVAFLQDCLGNCR